jgi:hypothetical protein
VQKYTAISSPGSFTGTASTSPVVVTGLTNGTAYTFTVAAGNATGNNIFSSASASVTPFNPASFESIATLTPTSGGSVTFSSIPSTYTHLQIRYIAQTDRATYPISVHTTRLNGDSGSNYTIHYLTGDGASAGSSQSTTSAQVYTGYVASNAATNVFGVGVIDILDYTNTNKYKTVLTLNGYDTNGNANGQGNAGVWSGTWMNSSAITSITMSFIFGSNYQSGTKFALYGIKG